LFYIGLDRRLMEAPIQVASDGRPIAGAAVPLFTTRIGVAIQPAVPGSQYVVSADGQSFLMNTLLPDSGPTPVRLIVNWKPQR
jgi:hypothetical protein